MGTPSDSEYAEFEEKVKRTVYIDNLAPQVTENILISALEQFGSVKNVQFIPNYLIRWNIPQCALVEMADQKQVKWVVSTVADFPFMICGMPRPVRARPAEMEMFADHPAKPGRKIHCRWVDSNDPEFESTRKLKHLAQKHSAEASFLLKQQQQEEENLAKKQQEALVGSYKKYEMMNALINDGTASRLAHYYDVKINDN